MISQANAYEFLRTAFEYEAIGKRIATLGRGDVEGLMAFACRLGFTFSPYDLTIALEWHIREMLEAQNLAQDELTFMLGVDDWEATLREWQNRFLQAA
jgi:hypothetical protein